MSEPVKSTDKHFFLYKFNNLFRIQLTKLLKSSFLKCLTEEEQTATLFK